ncbi:MULTISPECIES: YndJ family protein [Bacillus cereus group]|uniref:Membrane protein n=1 Tax=Bacillus mycoides TaxID=1405 RepID=A0A1E8BPR3_BACMY|nr:YndJ family protein [Bacillus mycoides]MBJ8070418.1 YndJ family protein [Bacillus cereus]MBJ8186611.1 YndJ family protein [Bacillus cereus]OFD96484.1 membrane protein [Bacillus mycoides]OFE01974.1 membrane protein [Bacillus mycoides]
MKNILFGLVCYIIFLIYEWSNINPVEAIILLSILLFIPMSFCIIDKETRNGTYLLFYKFVSFLYPIAAISAMLAFVTNHYFFALLWFAYTGIVALFGISRLLERGWKPLEEAAIDSAFIYLFLGGFWFFASVAKFPIMHFSSDIVLLTAAHFHYSAFLLPLSAGLLGRKREQGSKLYDAIMFIIVISPMTVAIGITYSRVFEFFAVFIYLCAIYGYGVYVWRTKFNAISAKILLTLSSSTLMVTIMFSLIYSYGNFKQAMTITIAQMVWIHGVVNGIGVALPAFVGWMIEKSAPKYKYYGKIMSRLRGNATVGEAFLHNRNLIDNKEYKGLVDKMNDFHSEAFDMAKIPLSIIRFYENTKEYELQSHIKWTRWFRPLAFCYEKMSKRVGQIHLGMGGKWETMHGSIIGVIDEKDGRENVRAWLRKNEAGESIFVALYSKHTHEDEKYMNIGLPLPYSNMTGILKLCNKNKDLIITSKLRRNGKGDEGIYLHTRFFTIRLPLAETFIIKESTDQILEANHRMWIFGVKFLEIDYEIKKIEEK